MSKTEKEYQKLPGKGRRAQGAIAVSGTYCSLWLGRDHLLQIESLGGYSEDYKRFYFRDIQALQIRKTKTGAAWNLFSGAIAFVLALIAWGIHDETGKIVLFFFAALFGLLFVINWFRGPTCVCHLKTAVHLEQLPSLSRLKKAQKVFQMIKASIEQAQGILTTEELHLHIQQAAQSEKIQEPDFTRSSISAPKFSKPYNGKIHQFLFCALLLDGVVGGIHLFFHPVFFVVIEMFVSLTFCGLSVVALVKQHESDFSRNLRRATWWAAGYAGFCLVAGYIEFIILSIGGAGHTQWDMMVEFSKIDPFHSVWLLCFLLPSVIFSLSLGAIGLNLLKKWRRSKIAFSGPPVIPSIENFPQVK